MISTTSLEYGDTFLVIAGHTADEKDLDTIYKFEPETEGWTLMPERLARPLHGVSAIPVYPGEFPEEN